MEKTRKSISMHTSDEAYDKVMKMAKDDRRSVANFIMMLVLDEWDRREARKEHD